MIHYTYFTLYIYYLLLYSLFITIILTYCCSGRGSSCSCTIFRSITSGDRGVTFTGYYINFKFSVFSVFYINRV